MRADEGNVGYRIWGVDNVVYGPVELPVLVNWVTDERVTADTWVFSEREQAWKRAAQLSELKLFFSDRAQPAATGEGEPGEVSFSSPGIPPGTLRRVKILADMSDYQLGRFARMMEVVQAAPFEEVVKQGTHGDAMYLVLSGEVRVRLMVGSKESILTTLGAGDFFGEASLFDQGPRSADVVANQESVLLKITAAVFQQLVTEYPDLATPFLAGIGRTMAARIRADNRRFRQAIIMAEASK